MPTNYPFPRPESIRQISGDLLGREVTVVKSELMPLERDTPAVIADYTCDTGAVAALCVTDLRLSNALGAALTMVNPATVEAAVTKWKIEEANLENLNEIVNIMARLFNSDDCDHLRWTTSHTLPGELPPEVTTLLREPLARRDYDVTVEEYGTGKLAILVS